MKPRVMSLVLFTCMVGLLIAPNNVDLKTSIISLLAVAIGSGAADQRGFQGLSDR